MILGFNVDANVDLMLLMFTKSPNWCIQCDMINYIYYIIFQIVYLYSFKNTHCDILTKMVSEVKVPFESIDGP